MKMISKTVGKCLTEYKREDFDQVVVNYTQFVKVSQFVYKKPHTLDQALKDNGKLLDSVPKYIAGDVIFGVNSDNSLTELISVIDSSD